MSRALRRHHRFRLRQKRQHYYGGWLAKHKNRKAHIVVETPTLCSCIMCSKGWWRREFGEITHKEKIAKVDAEEQLNTIGVVTLKWWVEPYTDFEGRVGYVVMYERDDGKRYSYGAHLTTIRDALSLGVNLFGTEPDYSCTNDSLGLTETENAT